MDNSIGQNLSSMQNYTMGSLSASSTRAAQTQGTGEVSLADVKPGQMFSGEIANITADAVEIMLDNHEMLHARMGEQVELAIGQRLQFAVKENQGGQITIRPVTEGVAQVNPAAEKALIAGGFSLSDRNLQIATSLMDAGMGLSKENMRSIMQQSVKFPEADIKQLVQMKVMGIPVNEESIKQFSDYTNHTHQMATAVNTTVGQAVQELTQIIQGAPYSEIQELAGELQEIFGWKADDTGTAEGQAQAQTVAAHGEETAVVSGQETVGNPAGEVAEANALPKQQQGETQVAGLAREAAGETLQAAGQAEASAQTEGVSAATEGASKSFADQPEGKLALQTLTEQGVPEQEAKALVRESKDAGNFIAKVSSYFTEKETASPQEQGSLAGKVQETAKHFFQSENFGKILGRAIQDQWVMKPEEMKQPKEIDELYDKMQEQNRMLQQSMEQHGGGEGYREQSQNLQDKIEFMQQLNNQFVFAQMPMRMNDGAVNSELFVYADRKRLMQSTDGVKVLLHLDMPNLGPTDVLIRLKDQKLHAKFTMEDDTSVTIVADNMAELAGKMADKGFVFTNEVLKSEKDEKEEKSVKTPDAAVDAMLDRDLVTGQKRYTFDMRS